MSFGITIAINSLILNGTKDIYFMAFGFNGTEVIGSPLGYFLLVVAIITNITNLPLTMLTYGLRYSGMMKATSILIKQHPEFIDFLVKKS